MAEDEDYSALGGSRVVWEILRRVEKKVEQVEVKLDKTNSRLDQFFYTEFNLIQNKLARYPEPGNIVLKEDFDPANFVLKKDFRPIQWAFNTIIIVLFLSFLAAILAAVGVHPYFEGVMK